MTIRTLKNDILAGITVAIVALPLALAFGVVSGAGAIAGLYGAIILGFIAALLGGVSVQVSGPTGPILQSNDSRRALRQGSMGGASISADSRARTAMRCRTGSRVWSATRGCRSCPATWHGLEHRSGA